MRVALTAGQRAELQQRLRQRTLSPRLRRLECIRLAGQGRPIPEIAARLGLDQARPAEHPPARRRRAGRAGRPGPAAAARASRARPRHLGRRRNHHRSVPFAALASASRTRPSDQANQPHCGLLARLRTRPPYGQRLTKRTASGGDLRRQDGRRLLAQVIGWPGRDPVIPSPSAQASRADQALRGKFPAVRIQPHNESWASRRRDSGACHIRATRRGAQGVTTVTHGQLGADDQDRRSRRSATRPSARTSKLVMRVRFPSSALRSAPVPGVISIA
jgi:hypothetical protein